MSEPCNSCEFIGTCIKHISPDENCSNYKPVNFVCTICKFSIERSMMPNYLLHFGLCGECFDKKYPWADTLNSLEKLPIEELIVLRNCINVEFIKRGQIHLRG